MFSIDLMRIYFSFFVEGLCIRSVVSNDVLLVSLAVPLVQRWKIKFILPHFVDGHIQGSFFMFVESGCISTNIEFTVP